MHNTSEEFPVLVIIGPSGSGKSTAVRRLHDQNLIEITPTWTTRPARPNEIEEGVEHKFVAENEFNVLQKLGFFVMVRQLFDLPFYYGLPEIKKPESEKIPLVMLRANLVASFSELYSKHVIYQIEDSYERIERRLLERSSHGEELGARLGIYAAEVDQGHELANRVFINDGDSEELANRLEKAIREDMF